MRGRPLGRSAMARAKLHIKPSENIGVTKIGEIKSAEKILALFGYENELVCQCEENITKS